MDHSVSDALQTGVKVTEVRAEALSALLAFLQHMEAIGCGPEEQWERVQVLQDEAFNQHLL